MFGPVRDYPKDSWESVGNARKRVNAKKYLVKKGYSRAETMGMRTETLVKMCQRERKCEK
jgi:hypothetical protein